MSPSTNSPQEKVLCFDPQKLLLFPEEKPKSIACVCRKNLEIALKKKPQFGRWDKLRIETMLEECCIHTHTSSAGLLSVPFPTRTMLQDPMNQYIRQVNNFSPYSCNLVPIYLTDLPEYFTKEQIVALFWIFTGVVPHYITNPVPRTQHPTVTLSNLNRPFFDSCSVYVPKNVAERCVTTLHMRILVDEAQFVFANTLVQVDWLDNYCQTIKRNTDCQIPHRPFQQIKAFFSSGSYAHKRMPKIPPLPVSLSQYLYNGRGDFSVDEMIPRHSIRPSRSSFVDSNGIPHKVNWKPINNQIRKGTIYAIKFHLTRLIAS
jgi:hypothetical protein